MIGKIERDFPRTGMEFNQVWIQIGGRTKWPRTVVFEEIDLFNRELVWIEMVNSFFDSFTTGTMTAAGIGKEKEEFFLR